MLKAVVFDFDGLIVDTESVWYEAFHYVLEGYGVSLKFEDFLEFVGTDGTSLFQSLCKRANNQLTVEELLTEGRKKHNDIMLGMDLRDGVLDYLTDAKRFGLKIGLASSSERTHIEPHLKRYKIEHFFDVIKTKNDVKNVKPDPELYLQVLKDLGINKEEAVAFEDSAHGLKAAVSAGVKCVVVPNKTTKGLHFENHALLLPSMSEMKMSDLFAKIGF